MTDRNEGYIKNYPISWDQLHRDSRALAWKLLDRADKFDKIIAIARGGLVPAAVIARELGIHYLDTVCITSYSDKDQGSTSVLKGINEDGKDCLIIDDLVDTGNTAQVVRKMLPKAHFATVYAKPAGKPLVDTYITEVSQDTWILFPWDSESQFIEPISKKY